MRKIVLIITICFLLFFTTSCSCKGFGGYNNKNAKEVAVDALPDAVNVEEGATYYEKSDLSLSFSSNGYFAVISCFNLDPNDENVRIYDNMYFHPGDYFYMLNSSYSGWFAGLVKDQDLDLCEEEHAEEDGKEFHIVFKKSGIYTLRFDLKQKKFKVVLKEEMETPLFYEIKNCEIYTLRTSYVKMVPNPDDKEELMVLGFDAYPKSGLIFYSENVHTSLYLVKLAEGYNNRFAVTIPNDRGYDDTVYPCVEGKVNVYLNTFSYEVRIEPADKENCKYGLHSYRKYIDDDLTVDENHPYIYHYTETIDGNSFGNEFNMTYYNAHSRKLDLTYIGDESLVVVDSYGNYYYRNPGKYLVTINVYDLTISVEKLK